MHCRDHYTVNCNLAVHKLVKPVESDSPRSRRRLYSGLAIAAVTALVIAVVGYSIGGTAGFGGQPAANAAQTAQQGVTGPAAAVPAQTSPPSAPSTDISDGTQVGAGMQQSATNGSRDPMAPADLNHVAAPLQSPLSSDTRQVPAPLRAGAAAVAALVNLGGGFKFALVRLDVPAVMSGQLPHCSVPLPLLPLG